jgi:hypothetical protein
LKNGLPKASLIAMKDAASPPVPSRNWRRLTPSFFAAVVGQLLDPELYLLLLFRLRMRHILAVGDHPGWNRRLKRLGLCRSASPELFVAQPCILFAGAGISL